MALSRRSPEYRRADAPLFLQPGPDGGRRPAASARHTVPTSASTSSSDDRDLLAPRHLVEHQRAADRFGRRLALPLAELLPVDVGLHRVDLLIDQPPHELLDPAIDLALEQRLPAPRR